MSTENIISVKRRRDNLLWVGTNKGPQSINLKTGAFNNYQYSPTDSNSISSNIVYLINEDRDGYIWIGTDNGLNRLDRKTEHFKKFLLNLPVINSYEESGESIWALSNIGLYKFDQKTDDFIPASNQYDILNGLLVTPWIEEDHGQNLWLNTNKEL